MTRRHSALVLSLLALLLAIPALRTQRPTPTPQQLAYQKPLNQFVSRLCPGSEIQVLSTQPLRLVGMIHAGPTRRFEVETSLHNLLGPEAQVLLLPGRAPWRPNPDLLWAGVAALGAFPTFLLLQSAARSLRAKIRPRRSWALAPAVLGAGVLCLGWPLWLLLPGLFALLAAMRRTAPHKQRGLREAAIYLMSRPPEFTAACLKLFKPYQVEQLTRTIGLLEAVSSAERARVLSAFQVEVSYTYRLLGLKLGGKVDPALAVRILTDKYLQPTHKVPTITIPVRGRRKIYSCPTCDEVFVDVDSLQRHQLHHLPARRRSGHLRVAAGLLVLALFTSAWFLTGRSVSQLALPGSQPLAAPQVQALAEAQQIAPRAQLLIVSGRGGTILAAPNADLRRVQPILGMPAIALPGAGGWLWWVGGQLALAAGLVAASRPKKAAAPPPPIAAPPPPPAVTSTPGSPEDLAIELGRDLVQLVNPDYGSFLTVRLAALRKHLTQELGLPLAPVHLRESPGLARGDYRLLFRGREVARGKLCVNRFLSIGPEEKLKGLRGDLISDPIHGLSSKWISPECRGDAERLGCMIFDAASVLANHLTEVVRDKACLLLTLDQLTPVLENERYQPLLQELAARQVDRVVIWRSLRLLLEERVSIRDLLTILEALLENADLTQDPDLLAEFARGALAAEICSGYANDQKTLHVFCLEPHLDHQLQTDESPILDPLFRQSIADQVRLAEERGLQAILLCAPCNRRYLYRHLHPSHPDLVVLSWNDIASDYNVNGVGLVSL
ncbi:MAG: FHIPEP family type III secretion protein [Candidatus Eremiobacteraeota bacterium]|nr:FHIPEP family type III secretion protein [Candidatus Eremiobacteraeota bacterium]